MMLSARNLTIGDRLSDISLDLEPGSITVICGPNGAGKSTLLEALSGLLLPDTGTVTLNSDLLADMEGRTRARLLGYLPQTHEIAWDVTVRSIVELGRLPFGDRSAAPVDTALEALDIGQLADRRAQSLSGGETARVLLARVLAGEPRWILADEPLAALDIAHQLALLRHLRVAASSGKGVVLVLHDLAHAMNHADRVIVLDDGAKAADGKPRDALSPKLIERVWGVPCRWIGEAGGQALVTGPSVTQS